MKIAVTDFAWVLENSHEMRNKFYRPPRENARIYAITQMITTRPECRNDRIL